MSQADKAIGLYNFCVKRDVQGQGIGKKIAINVLKLAALQKKAVYLQCEPKLAGWYERFGFKTIGSVDIYGIAS